MCYVNLIEKEMRQGVCENGFSVFSFFMCPVYRTYEML